MSSELEKIDAIRERLGVTYREAKETLESVQGNLIEALIKLEEKLEAKHGGNLEGKLRDQGQKVWDQIKDMVQKGKVTRIKIKKGDETVLEMPASIGALGIAGMLASTELALLAGAGTIAGMLNKYTLELEKPDGENEFPDEDGSH
ncbi:MAG: DUF4342 domain-containing protein [Bacillota bacterium]